jgi:hypothetical protein
MPVDGALVTTSKATQWTSVDPSKSVVLLGTTGPAKYVKVCPLTFNPEKGVPIKAGSVKYYELPASEEGSGISIKPDGTIVPSEGYTDVTQDFIECFKGLNDKAQKYNLKEKLIGYGPYDRRRYVHWMCVKSPDEPDGLNPVAILGWPMLDSISPRLILQSFDDAVTLASLLLQSKEGTAKNNIELLLSVTLRLYAGGYKSEPIDDRSFFYSMFSIPDYQCDCDDMSMIVAAVATALKKVTVDQLAKLSDDAKELIAYLQKNIDGIYVAHGQANTPQGERMIGHVWVIMTKKPEPQSKTARDQQVGWEGVIEGQQDVGQELQKLPNFTDCLLIESTTSSAPNQSSTKAAKQVGLQARCTFNISGVIQNSEISIRMLPRGYDYVTIALYGVNEAYALAHINSKKEKELGVPYEKLTTGTGITCIPLHDFESTLSTVAKRKVEIVRSLATKYSAELFGDTDLRTKITSTLQSVPPGSVVENVSAGVLVPSQLIQPSGNNSSGVTFYDLFTTVSWAYKPICPAGDATLEVTS